MKNFISLTLMMVFLLLTVDAQAQRKKRKRRTTNEEVKIEQSSIKEKLNPEIKIGTALGGGSNASYSVLTISAKPGLGYKLNKYFTAGLGAKVFYTYVNYRFSDDNDNIVDLGAFAYARAKIAQVYYIQAEYNYTKFDSYGSLPALKKFYPSIGLGYVNGVGDWSFGIEGMINLDDDVIDRNNLYETWFNLSYNF